MKRLLCLLAVLGWAALGGSGHARADLVVNGDFESGNSGFTSGYQYVTQINSENQYTIGTNPSTASTYTDWASFGDHTSGHGNMLIANGDTTANTSVWSETVNVQQNTTYVFSFWGANADQTSQSLPELQGYVNSSTVGNSPTLTTMGGTWVQGTGSWYSGSNTAAVLSIVDLNTNAGWNDFALDDIHFNINTVPEPSSALVAAFGIISAAGIWLRQAMRRGNS